MFANPESHPPADRPGPDRTLPWVLGTFSLILVVAALTAVQAVRNMQRARLASDWVNHSHAVVSECGALLTELYAAEAALRSYALTGHALDRAAGREAIDAIEEHGTVLQALTEAEPDQRARSTRIDGLLRRRAEFLLGALDAEPGAGTLKRRLADDLGLAGTHEIKAELERLKGLVLAQLAERDHVHFQQTQTTRLIVWTGLGLNLVLLVGVAWLIRNDLAARRRQAVHMRDDNERLASAVAEQTAQLRAANELLEEENNEHRWANLALEHQVKYNQTIVNALREPVLVVTKAMNVTRANPAALELLGLIEEEVVNRPLAELVQLATPAADADLLARTLHHGRDLRFQPALARGRRNPPCPCLLTLFPLRDGDNVVGGVAVLDEHRTEPSR